MHGYLLFWALLELGHAFNVDQESASIHLGPNNSQFGFAVAQHFRGGRPTLLVGAPKAESHQPGTREAGAVFACPISTGVHRNCQHLRVEYPTEAEHRTQPRRLHSKILHPEGKNHQLLGFVVQSSGTSNGQAMVCAPLLRWGLNAYTDGVCYLLRNDLNHSSILSTCNPLPKKDRHNDYGACEQGFSAYLDENIILTGLPGARKWTGGVFGRYMFTVDGFPDSVDRWTMEVNKQQNGVINMLASHDYLGYSVRYGRFGFPYETDDKRNFTIVSGATRYGQTGAVVFLPFYGSARPGEEKVLGLHESRFILEGFQLGSGFGYQVEVLDLNNDGAPFEFHLEEDVEFGGAVYVFYSNGRKVMFGQENTVFKPPIVIRGLGLYSQFGLSLSSLGDIDRDEKGYTDFVVGAPFADHGHGAVYIYHGSSFEQFDTKAKQIITGSSLSQFPRSKPLRTFGSAVSGQIDLDGNGYPDLAVGAFASDAAFLFRTRPVVDVKLGHSLTQKYIKINEGLSCPRGSRTCFDVITTWTLLDPHRVVDFDGQNFVCELKVVPAAPGVSTRAVFSQTGSPTMVWPCSAAANRQQQRRHELHIPASNQDWVNPLAFNFTIRIEPTSRTEVAPIVRESQSFELFETSFDKKCGEDNDCYTDISIRPVLLNMTRTANGTYTSRVTERDSINIRFLVENRRERAFLARLYVFYNHDELDEPRLSSHRDGVDIERKSGDVVVLSLGNPLEEGHKLNFDLSFPLVRSSSERVSTELVFKVLANSTSIEEYPMDNEWTAQVKLIKEADLELIGVSKPPIVRFAKGNARPSYEEDIGSEVVHAYTVINHGPFYAKNVTVTINWPLKLNHKTDQWILYTLEEPIIRHQGHVHKCSIDPVLKAINPAEIYMDETLKLAYSTYGLLKSQPRTKRRINDADNHDKAEEEEGVFSLSKVASILDSEFIKTKDVTEFSGATVKIVEINCKDGSAICYPLRCHFDYIGTEESALIEIRARLWNYTFSADYQRIEYVAVTSSGVVEVDPQQGLLEDIKNNFASATTHAYPDRPSQQDKLNLGILLLAILVGLTLLAILVLICYKCGFFKRKRPDRHMLHRAEYQLQREMYATD